MSIQTSLGLDAFLQMRDINITRMNNEERIGRWISDGLIVAVCSIVAYLITFVYEAGFLGVFKIPLGFITLNLTTVFIVASGLLFIVLLGLSIVNFVYPFVASKSEGNSVYRSLKRFSPLFILLLVLFVLFGSNWKEWLPCLIIVIFYSFLEFAFPLITQRTHKTYHDKLDSQEVTEAQVDTLVDYARRRFGYRTLYVFAWMCLFLVISYSAGRAEAFRKDEFLVLPTHPEAVVLRIYGDIMISAPFDRERKIIHRSLFLTRVPNDSKLILKVEKVGPLRLTENEPEIAK